jgi:hypothetical protein
VSGGDLKRKAATQGQGGGHAGMLLRGSAEEEVADGDLQHVLFESYRDINQPDSKQGALPVANNDDQLTPRRPTRGGRVRARPPTDGIVSGSVN